MVLKLGIAADKYRANHRGVGRIRIQPGAQSYVRPGAWLQVSLILCPGEQQERPFQHQCSTHIGLHLPWSSYGQQARGSQTSTSVDMWGAVGLCPVVGWIEWVQLGV
jgi:hypothetical protein